MNLYKNLRRTNKTFIFITVGLYFTIYLGMIFQIILGFTQIVIALILTSKIAELSKSTIRKIKIYWILVLLSTILIYLNFNYGNDFGNFIFLFLIPMLIATYFYYLTANINSDSFLNAQWNNLALINYEIDAKI
jgi:hypothetical protein